MIRLLLVWLFLYSAIFANIGDTGQDINNSANTAEAIPYDESTSEEKSGALEKVIYLSYENIPQRVLKGEIFKVTIKAVSTVKDFVDITYELTNSEGLKLLSDFPSRKIDSNNYYETFYFLATSENIRLPDFKATLLDYNNKRYETTTLVGDRLNVISLNPKSDFSKIIADSFEIVEYKTTSYDATYNIVVFVASATNSNISALKLNGVFKQGVESVADSYLNSKITYYAIIDKGVETLEFSYFNLVKNRFIQVNIPIIVNDDSVTTQSDLKPKDQSHEMLKMGIASIIAIIAFIIILWRKKYIYLTFIIIPLIYVLYTGTPSREICIKEGAGIYLLPVANGTIFETTASQYSLQKEFEIKGWAKVQLKDKKIGWVKDEDICSN